MTIELEHYFYDTYAIIEILKDNPRYFFYSDKPVFITKLNLFEIYYYLLRTQGESLSDEFYEAYEERIMDYDFSVIKAAAKLKRKFKERKMSMTDCIGYSLALSKSLKFLTGDKAFKDLPNVEFVK